MLSGCGFFHSFLKCSFHKLLPQRSVCLLFYLWVGGGHQSSPMSQPLVLERQDMLTKLAASSSCLRLQNTHLGFSVRERLTVLNHAAHLKSPACSVHGWTVGLMDFSQTFYPTVSLLLLLVFMIQKSQKPWGLRQNVLLQSCLSSPFCFSVWNKVLPKLP